MNLLLSVSIILVFITLSYSNPRSVSGIIKDVQCEVEAAINATAHMNGLEPIRAKLIENSKKLKSEDMRVVAGVFPVIASQIDEMISSCGEQREAVMSVMDDCHRNCMMTMGKA